MTNAILPLNVKALRVNQNDQDVLTDKFKGRTAVFENMPYRQGSSTPTVPSTGEAIYQPLEEAASPITSLKAGIHLHWELPDVFKRGLMAQEGGPVTFPHAPNTWLVIRHLQLWDATAKAYGALRTMAWIVESDYVSDTPIRDSRNRVRPAITVPLPETPDLGQKPFMYMGRVVDYDKWTGPEAPENYLPHYGDSYLTSIGFVGPSFASFYPDCNSVFGFWDDFADAGDLATKIATNAAVKFRTSYQVTGWVRDTGNDVLAGFKSKVIKAYDHYVQQAKHEKTPVRKTPADVLVQQAQDDFKLGFNAADIGFALNPDKTVQTLDAPLATLSSGLVQEIVWDMLSSPGSTYFLRNPDGPQPNPIWTDTQIRAAVGNTTAEGLSALIKHDVLHPAAKANVSDYEVLLNALQSGLLHDLESNGSALATLEETLHARSFSKVFGGYVWTVAPKDTAGARTPQGNVDAEITLPLRIAEILTRLNQAQKRYNQGRLALEDMRSQVFMDWLRYVQAYVDPQGGRLNVDLNTLIAFIDNGGPDCELGHVVAQGKRTGLQTYRHDAESGQIIGLEQPADGQSLAGQVYTAFQDLLAAIQSHKDWIVRASAAPAFWAPTDPVMVMEGDRLQPVRRNGDFKITPARISGEVLSQIDIAYQGAQFAVPVSQLAGRPDISAVTPHQDDVAACIYEGFLLVPMLADAVAQAVAAQPATPNPAKDDLAGCVVSLTAAQGGLSPLEPHYVADGGLFGALHRQNAKPIRTPSQADAGPQKLTVTWTNAAGTGWSPYGAALSTQTLLASFDPARVDPFLPVFLVWGATLDPLVRDKGNDYTADTLTRYFELDASAIDYTYALTNGKAPPFTLDAMLGYRGAVTLSRQPTQSLTAEIDRYKRLYPDTDADKKLDDAKRAYDRAQIVSQGIGGFNLHQTLRRTIAKVPVEDLAFGARDAVTTAVDTAASADAQDNWYDAAFNGLLPIAKGLLAQNNFGPLRAGFGQITDLEIVDAFGQRMTLQTSVMHPNGAQDVIAAHTLNPVAGDAAHQQDLFFPPRLIPPSRVWFKFLSARFDSKVKGFDEDFVEINTHPATSPVCGWIVPNHLDQSLFFYDFNGAAIGSFGIEHDDLVYRTRAGNLNNPKDSLAVDIGPETGPPLVNPHLFDVMWHVARQDAAFLRALMSTITASEGFMNPKQSAQSMSLSVLMGRPLALTRAVIGLESAGNVLPVSQADYSDKAAFSQDVLNGRYKYADRQKASSAALETVQIPVQLGNLHNIDDGLIGYFIDGTGSVGPYGTFYAPAAPVTGGTGVERPQADTVVLTLNGAQRTVTVLMDPRGPVHATTGLLPVEALQIPQDQYGKAMEALELTFFTHPVLSGKAGLTLPLPSESGYKWDWIQPGSAQITPLEPNTGTDVARFDYTPQTVLEGFTRLTRAPKPPKAAHKRTDADD